MFISFRSSSQSQPTRPHQHVPCLNLIPTQTLTICGHDFSLEVPASIVIWLVYWSQNIYWFREFKILEQKLCFFFVFLFSGFLSFVLLSPGNDFRRPTIQQLQWHALPRLHRNPAGGILTRASEAGLCLCRHHLPVNNIQGTSSVSDSRWDPRRRTALRYSTFRFLSYYLTVNTELEEDQYIEIWRSEGGWRVSDHAGRSRGRRR